MVSKERGILEPPFEGSTVAVSLVMGEEGFSIESLIGLYSEKDFLDSMFLQQMNEKKNENRTNRIVP